MQIEQVVIDDLSEILSLQKLAFQNEAEIYSDCKIPPLTQSLEDIKEEFQQKVFLKAAVNSEIIGSVRAFKEKRSCYIGKLIVHPDFQNQGVGTRLIQEVEGIFRDAEYFVLWTGHKSEKSICFYQKLGYKAVKATFDIRDNKFLRLEKRKYRVTE
ncbi:MAG: GNAT family N-acetyltransferase [Candidatus Kaelpia imicola]|nr:GNAT family N-acetyltransferase [Candidatus Kaelpia imicola]